VGIVTLLASGQRLASHAEASSSALGTSIAAASIVVLGGLSLRKHVIARRIGSRPLQADGWLSATGCVLGAITVIGSVLNAQLDWWWADPGAAAIIGIAATVLAWSMRRGAES
jgi:divalent metal cation (Fe/Co/Zn/Cd) transporter